MKCLAVAWLGLAVVLGAVSAARSADLPTLKSPAPAAAPPAAAIDWSGFYVRGVAGWSFGEAAQGYSVSSTWVEANAPSIIPFVDGVGSQRLDPRGGDIGPEVGYDWKLQNGVIVGVAGDVSWGDLAGARTTSGTLPVVLLPFSINQQLSEDWRGSLRLKAGVTPLDNLLLYATGGPAVGHFNYTASFWDQLIPPFLPGNETENASFHAFRLGWTAGAGAEWALTRNWAISAEYRYSDYGAVSGTGVLPLQQPPSTAYIGHSTGQIGVNSLRLGLGYHFE